MSIFGDFGKAARAHRAPATVALIALLIAGFLAAWMNLAPAMTRELGFVTGDALQKPWTFLTYPFLSDSLIGLLFLCLWLWGIGGWVERDLGTRRFVIVWIAFSILSALALFLGATVLDRVATLRGAWTPIAALTIIWGTRNSDAQVMLMFVLPITGKWLAWLSAALVLFGTSPPELAVFVAAPLALAYYFAADRLPFASYSGGPGRAKGENAAGTRRVYSQDYYDEVKRREQAREEKERLRRLFEQSVADEDEPER